MSTTLKKITATAGWTATELQHHPDWIHYLTAAETLELSAAVKNSDTQKFTLPQLSQTIREKFLIQLEEGIGCLLIRGIEANKYTPAELGKLFWGLGLHFGTPVSQSTRGELLHEVTDEGYKLGDSKMRGTNSNIKLWFHNDPCDVAGLLCVRPAQEGGVSQIVSSIAIHNKMLEECPELLQQLYQPYYFQRHNVDTAAEYDYFARPICAIEQGYFVCNILRRMIDTAQDLPQVPKMTAQQIRALDKFEQLAASPELCHCFMLEPGDILFVNNYITLHSRHAFVDDINPDKKRLLLRLWLSVANSRPLPESYRMTYREIRVGRVRGGIDKLNTQS